MLSATSQYALRALAHMAALPKGTSILGRELARRTAIPQNYLSKVLLVLGDAGIIDASRGTGGGYRLRRRPEKVRLEQIIELFDKAFTKPPCLLGLRRECSDANACSAHSSWRHAKSVYLNFLRTTTLADIAVDSWAEPE
jgi:Rrf2 family transcriptional regulator, iron-sulfur cluster assembly transcription factor